MELPLPDSPEEHVLFGQMFPVLSPDELACVATYATPLWYDAGEYVVRAGQPSKGVQFIKTGHVEVSQRDGLGRTAHIVTMEPGCFLGEVGQLSGGVVMVDARGNESVETLLVSPARLRALIVANAELGEKL